MTTSQFLALSFLLLLLMASYWRLFFKKKKRKTVDFPAAWRRILGEKVAFYNQLQASEKARFEVGVLLFLDEVRIVGVGTVVDDTDRLLVAASAVIPLFGFPGWRYRPILMNMEVPTRRSFSVW